MSNWNNYVSQAKTLIEAIKANRLQIGRLAILATELPGNDMTMTRFATEIGITVQTLSKWVAAYKAYRKKHPLKEPEPKDYKPAAKAAATAAAERKAANPLPTKTGRPKIAITIKSKSFLDEVNRMKERFKVKAEVKALDDGVRKELIVKLREIATLLEKA